MHINNIFYTVPYCVVPSRRTSQYALFKPCRRSDDDDRESSVFCVEVKTKMARQQRSSSFYRQRATCNVSSIESARGL